MSLYFFLYLSLQTRFNSIFSGFNLMFFQSSILAQILLHFYCFMFLITFHHLYVNISIFFFMFVSIFTFECLNISTHFRHFKFCFVFSQIKNSIKNHTYMLSYSHSLKCPRHGFCFSFFYLQIVRFVLSCYFQKNFIRVFIQVLVPVVIALQKDFSKSLHCKRILEFSLYI